MEVYNCLIDFKVAYYVSAHQNLSSGTQIMSLLGKIGENLGRYL